MNTGSNETSMLIITNQSIEIGAEMALKPLTCIVMGARIHTGMLITAILKLVNVTIKKKTYQPKFTAWLNSACTSTVCGGEMNTLILVTPSSKLGLKQFKMLAVPVKTRKAPVLFSTKMCLSNSVRAHRSQLKRSGRLGTSSQEDQPGDKFTITVSCTMTTWGSRLLVPMLMHPSSVNAKLSTITLRTKMSSTNLTNLTTDTKPILNYVVY